MFLFFFLDSQIQEAPIERSFETMHAKPVSPRKRKDTSFDLKLKVIGGSTNFEKGGGIVAASLD